MTWSGQPPHKCGIFHNFFLTGSLTYSLQFVILFMAINAPVPGYVINTDECMDAAGSNV